MTTRTITTAILISLSATAGLADDDCDVPMADWQPRQAVRAMIEQRGWKLHRIKIHDGCYEAYVTDAAGKRFEVIVDPATLAITGFESDRRHR